MMWKFLSLLRQFVLKAGPRVWQGNSGQKMLDMWFVDTISHLYRNQNRNVIIPRRSVEDPFVWWCKNTWHPWNTDKDLRILYKQKHCLQKRQRQDKMKKECLKGRATNAEAKEGKAMAQRPGLMVVSVSPEAEQWAREDYSQALRTNRICPAEFETNNPLIPSNFPLSER